MATDSPLLEKAGSADRASLQALLDAIASAETTTTDAASSASEDAQAASASATTAQTAAEATEAAKTAADTINALAPLSRSIVVDARYADNDENSVFGTLSDAVLYARGVVDTDGGEVLIRVYHDAGGEPISVDPRDHGITPDPLDAHIRIVSPIFGRQKQDLLMYGTLDHADLAGTIRHDDLATTIHITE